MDFGSVENRQKLMVIEARVTDMATIVSNYSLDNHTLNSMGERRNAAYLELVLRELGKLIHILLVAE